MYHYVPTTGKEAYLQGQKVPCISNGFKIKQGVMQKQLNHFRRDYNEQNSCFFSKKGLSKILRFHRYIVKIKNKGPYRGEGGQLAGSLFSNLFEIFDHTAKKNFIAIRRKFDFSDRREKKLNAIRFYRARARVSKLQVGTVFVYNVHLHEIVKLRKT